MLRFIVLVAVLVLVMLIRSVEFPGEATLANGTPRNVAQYVEMRNGARLFVDGRRA